MPKFKAFEPTKFVFLLRTMAKWDSSNGTTYFALNDLEKSSYFSSANLGLPYLEKSL